MERGKKRGTKNEHGNGNEKGIQTLREKEFDNFRRGRSERMENLRFFIGFYGVDKHIPARAHYHKSKESITLFFFFLVRTKPPPLSH